MTKTIYEVVAQHVENRDTRELSKMSQQLQTYIEGVKSHVPEFKNPSIAQTNIQEALKKQAYIERALFLMT